MLVWPDLFDLFIASYEHLKAEHAKLSKVMEKKLEADLEAKWEQSMESVQQAFKKGKFAELKRALK